MRNKISCLILGVCLLWATPAFAQVELVQAVKNDLVARHVDISGPCGAFEITKRVAWILREQGYGLLDKPSGNNCQGYSIDFLVTPALGGIDILGDAGGDNTPAWGESEPPGTFAGRFRAPFDPGDTPTPPPPPGGNPGPPPATSGQLDRIESKIDAHESVMAAERAKAQEEREKQEAFREGVRSEYRKFGLFVVKYILPVIGGIFAGRAVND